MKLNKILIDRIAKKTVDSLLQRDMIIWEEPREKLEAIIVEIITKDLMVEDQLNEEVKALLEARTKDYERNMMDYGRVFHMVKAKLVRERNLIL